MPVEKSFAFYAIVAIVSICNDPVVGQHNDERIAELERQVNNLTALVASIRSECESNRVSLLEQCVCRRKCVDESGVERPHDSTWNRDLCATCTCHDESVVCSERRDNPRCVGGCLLRSGVLYANGESYQRDVCTSCTCRNGTDDCVTAQCPALSCEKKVNVSGHCCPRCLGCDYFGRDIPYRRSFRPDACTICTCLTDVPSVTCQVRTCPEPPNCIGTPVKTRSVCCPFCQDCMERGNGETWTVDDCTNCTCLRGEEKCVTQTCPPINCDHPVKLPGQCCPSCEIGCLYEGTLYRDGEGFNTTDNCTHCKCVGGSVTCITELCTALTCINKIRLEGQCCEQCPTCEVNGTTYAHNEEVHLSICERCLCRDGKLTQCQKRVCRPLTCSIEHRYQPVRRCCPECRPCQFDGQLFRQDETFVPQSDRCAVCTCQDTLVSCEPVICDLSCTHPAPSESPCCANCSACLFNGTVYDNQREFLNPNDKCSRCECKNGNVTCSHVPCPVLDCDNAFLREGSCCPTCPPKNCEFEDQIISHLSEVQSRENPCVRCECNNGNVTCVTQRCNVACLNPLPPAPGVCCSNCDDGCLYNGSSYSSNEIFSVDDCTSCQCLRSTLNCTTTICPKESCRKTRKIPGQCCPVCQICSYEGNRYEDGDQFVSALDPCLRCSCTDRTVSCSQISCSSCQHYRPILPGDCCPNCTDCYLNGVDYKQGIPFINPSDNCSTCSCSYGNISCLPSPCPEISCDETILLPGSCCPICRPICIYEGIRYNDGDSFVPASNSCLSCSCRGRTVNCSTLPCLVCSHPAPKGRDECCDHCGPCVYEGTLHSDKTTFISTSDPCQMCSCKDGNVVCNSIDCPDLSCRNPVSKPGQCCQECPPDCVYEGGTYEDGAAWVSQSNPCQLCTCQGGTTNCSRIVCPPSTCSHPQVIPGQCCSECGQGCTFDNATYANGQTFYETSCRQCTCIEGNVVCVKEECPSLTCSLFAVAEGECCPTCRPCLHGGRIREHGDSWIGEDDVCQSFYCMDGIVSETNIQCAGECDNVFSASDECCPICPGACVDDGKSYAVNETFSLVADPCVRCTCKELGLLCVREICPVQVCSGRLIPFDTSCCPICLIDSPTPRPTPTPRFEPLPTRKENECVFERQIYLPGEHFMASDNPCTNCTCVARKNVSDAQTDFVTDQMMAKFDHRLRLFGSTAEEGQVLCRVINCPAPPCALEKRIVPKGQCCEICQFNSCIRRGLEYKHDEVVWMDEYGCNNCTCSDGELVNCIAAVCPLLVCPRGTRLRFLEGECCRQCVAVPLCIFEGNEYQHDQVWKGRCRTYTCRNERVTHTEQVCPPLQCRENEIPIRKPTECCSRCVPKPASCEAFGDPHYRTFDGHLHHYQGRCYYIMARDCLNNDFTVLVQNDQRGHTGVSWTQEVTFNRVNVSVTLLQGLRVRANGQVVDLPYIYSPYVYVKLEGGLVAVETDIGVSLMWNGDSIISVSVPSDYAGKMCGLCGNYNGNAFDDQRLRDGRVALDLNEFGNAWQVKRLGDKCDERGGVSDPCKQRSHSHRESAREKCSILLGDVFKPCHGTVDHTQYFYSCMFDVCACARSESHCLCSAIEAYANECARKGVELRGRWRTGPCAFQCPTERGFVYDDCAPPCRETCDTYHQKIRCVLPCVSACTCLAGLVEHNGRCIAAARCPRS
ncbi:kielin/chordin-like protein [Oscarella lobularis]|uniref:kielin/chordin-like protein n=1 Tax=Oscarella lobularis TaxID=121494 RepID=UPI0033137344